MKNQNYLVIILAVMGILFSFQHRKDYVTYFAYPFGSWNERAINKLKMYGFIAAFQLEGRRDVSNPLFTIRRIMVDGNWNEKQLMKAIKYFR
jgi:hypothetical protein